ncbi:MAG: hypothetical protein WC758_06980 [Candidatus Woesearchaeota archaeon]|jgi:hypothetical protein
MNMKKTVRKMSAILAGATMVGATVMGAMAYDLSDYPSPFITDGFFTGKIVVGDKAMPADIIGATDIASALQAAAVTPVESDGTTTTSNVEGGYLFSESDDLIFGDDLVDVNAIVDDTELPELLAHGLVENDDGDEFEYDQEIQLQTSVGGVNADVSNYNINDESATPVIYYDLASEDFYKTVVDFEDTWSATDFVNSESIELFGQMYTFDPNNANADDFLVLFGTESEVYIEKGEKATVKYDGEDYTVEVIGGNSDGSSAIVRVGTETKTMIEGDSKTIGGLPIYVKDVFISNVGGENVAVQLFIGSNKIELEYSATAGDVKLNGKVLDEVTVAVTKTGTANWQTVSMLTFTVTPNDGDAETEYIASGDSYTDPLFGTFKFNFVGSEDLEDNKEELNFARSGGKAQVTFVPQDGEAYTLDVVEDAALADDFVGTGNLDNLVEDKIFIYNDLDDAEQVVTHVLQISKIKDGNNLSSVDFEVQVDDLTFDKTYSVTKCETISSEIALSPQAGGAATQIDFTAEDSDCTGGSLAAGVVVLYSEAGAKVTMTLTNVSEPVFTVDEDYQDDDETSTGLTNIVATGVYDTVDDEYDFSLSGGLTTALDDDDNVDYYLSDFGTYVAEETDDSGAYINMFVPAEEVTYDMWLSPVASTVVVVGGSSGDESYTINPLPVGSTVLDKDAMNLIGNTPLIVVGGPFVNTVAAELMGNPTAEQINTMFTSGLGKIKLYPTQNALLVAGYSAQDTLGAAYVLAQYADYDLTGTEVEVVVPSLSSISVRTPSSN